MRDGIHAPRRLSWRTGGPAKPWRDLLRRLAGRREIDTSGLDARARRDIGLPCDGPRGIGDVRLAFDRNLLRRGQPLP